MLGCAGRWCAHRGPRISADTVMVMIDCPCWLPLQEQQVAILQELRKIYAEAVEPLETEFGYDQFKPSYFGDILTCSTPLILFIGVSFPSSCILHPYGYHGCFLQQLAHVVLQGPSLLVRPHSSTICLVVITCGLALSPRTELIGCNFFPRNNASVLQVQQEPVMLPLNEEAEMLKTRSFLIF